MAQAASPLVYQVLTRLAVFDVPGTGLLKSALWAACREPELAAFDTAIDTAMKLGWIAVDDAYVELTRLGLLAAQHAEPASAEPQPASTSVPTLPLRLRPRDRLA